MRPPTSKAALPDVTLVAVTSVALRPTVEALEASIRQADFADVLLLSDQPPPAGTDPAIGWRPIERLTSRSAYSNFMLRDLADHVKSSHALCVQWDGFVLDGSAWDPRFLDFDYIGAVWPQFGDGHNVGNGGFSLRSRRLLEACRAFPSDGSDAEDIIIARRRRPELEMQGMKFAPASVAAQFAYERAVPTGREFGFHGAFNLVRYLSPRKALELFRTLEPGVLTRNEHVELLRWTLARGRLRLAATLLGRLA